MGAAKTLLSTEIVRVIQAFRKDTERLALEEPLRDINLEQLQMIFRVPKGDPMYDCWTVEKEHVPMLQPQVDSRIDLDRYMYQVSAYAEPPAK